MVERPKFDPRNEQLLCDVLEERNGPERLPELLEVLYGFLEGKRP